MLRGRLFTQDFLTEGIIAYDKWQRLADIEVEGFREKLLQVTKSQVRSIHKTGNFA